ncbi:hypothetical protein PGTUg99_023017 [Puccinia graminis f. sp. tritici]|uniref:Uncharacterized protein n=1 Tax=Puccinia graminis f. sp. tritici TaxID=56615 RepID=A0A5B0RL25_PUCGR|nr:hypothetical protein PGTUg99_023017 [Puccinia graminis f. sp. tritici]
MRMKPPQDYNVTYSKLEQVEEDSEKTVQPYGVLFPGQVNYLVINGTMFVLLRVNYANLHPRKLSSSEITLCSAALLLPSSSQLNQENRSKASRDLNPVDVLTNIKCPTQPIVPQATKFAMSVSIIPGHFQEDLADRDKSKPAASSRDGFIQSHFQSTDNITSASPVSSTKPSNHPTNVNNTTASSGPIGLQADHVYCSQLSPWRFKIWSILLVTLNKEIPILESIQRSYRSGPLDRLMIHSSWLSSHQFFIVALPLIFWLGDHHFGQLQVISLGS